MLTCLDRPCYGFIYSLFSASFIFSSLYKPSKGSFMWFDDKENNSMLVLQSERLIALY